MRSEGSTASFGRLVQRLGRAFARSNSAHGEARELPEREAAYRMLGLEPGADPRIVRQAFRRLAAAHHPDRYQNVLARDRAAIVRRFSEITAAYHAIVT